MKYLCFILLSTSVAGRFRDDFYRLLAKDNAQKNLIASPFSVEIAMTMAYMGAEGTTADELRTALNLTTDKTQVASKYKELLNNLQDQEKDVVIQLANRIYVNNEYSPVPEYNEVLKDSFKADAVPISLSDAKNATDTVNQWVSKQTHGKISQVVTSEDMNSKLRALLLNAIYFKGQWMKKFDEKFTKEKNFRVSGTEHSPVQMMAKRGTYKAAYLDDLDAKVLKLPYRNSNLSMLIFLPNKVDGLSKLEDKIIGFSRRLFRKKVHIQIPKFKIEFENELKDLLQKLGIRDAFSENANFEGLVLKQKVYIDKVIQKAFVEVNEEGGEAAAATAALEPKEASESTSDQDIMTFKADHPFAYVIRDKKTVYFQGHFVKP